MVGCRVLPQACHEPLHGRCEVNDAGLLGLLSSLVLRDDQPLPKDMLPFQAAKLSRAGTCLPKGPDEEAEGAAGGSKDCPKLIVVECTLASVGAWALHALKGIGAEKTFFESPGHRAKRDATGVVLGGFIPRVRVDPFGDVEGAKVLWPQASANFWQ